MSGTPNDGFGSAASDVSNVAAIAATQKKGMQYKPYIIEADLEDFERHINGTRSTS